MALWNRHPGQQPEYPNNRGCGGTLVATRFVITAAHCFYEEDEETKLITGKLEAGDVAVRIGEHNLVTFGETGLEQFVNVKKINIHDGYQQVIGEKAWKGSYDFAIIELDTDVPIETYTPACIARATDGTTFDGKNLTMAGWGLLSDYPQEPHITTNVPYEVNVTVAENCQQNPRPTEMCVGLYTIGKGSCLVRHGALLVRILCVLLTLDVLVNMLNMLFVCQGDSGGPATYKQGDQHILAGVDNKAWFQCTIISIVARVAFYRPYIDDILSGAIFCRNSGNADD